LLLAALDVQLALDGDDTLLGEARTLISSITAGLAKADETMRSRFVASETVRRIQTQIRGATAGSNSRTW
jgi:hypothetical protein